MKLSKSKLALAKVINENGGWIDGSEICSYNKHIRQCVFYLNGFMAGGFDANPFHNWHQCALSREEYYHAYPKADDDGWIEWNGGECPVDVELYVYVNYRDGCELPRAVRAGSQRWDHFGLVGDIIAYRLHKPEVKPELCESVMRSIPEPEFDDAVSRLAKALELVKSAAPHMLRDKYKFDGNEVMGERKPTIDHLAQDYRNKLDFAKRKRQEADEAKAASDAALGELERAGEALGLLIGIAKPDREPELVITDWRDLKVGDVIEITGSSNNCWKDHSGQEMTVKDVHPEQGDNDDQVDLIGESGDWCLGGNTTWRFIRRP